MSRQEEFNHEEFLMSSVDDYRNEPEYLGKTKKTEAEYDAELDRIAAARLAKRKQNWTYAYVAPHFNKLVKVRA